MIHNTEQTFWRECCSFWILLNRNVLAFLSQLYFLLLKHVECSNDVYQVLVLLCFAEKCLPFTSGDHLIMFTHV